MSSLKSPKGVQKMFKIQQLGCVNKNKLGEYEPETLVVCGYELAREMKTGWNMFPCPGRVGLFRVVDRVGNPPYPLVEMTEADLEGVTVEEWKEARVTPDAFVELISSSS
jgi:hypothetical protein